MKGTQYKQHGLLFGTEISLTEFKPSNLLMAAERENE